jgi:hypothetical protein
MRKRLWRTSVPRGLRALIADDLSWRHGLKDKSGGIERALYGVCRQIL